MYSIAISFTLHPVKYASSCVVALEDDAKDKSNATTMKATTDKSNVNTIKRWLK